MASAPNQDICRFFMKAEIDPKSLIQLSETLLIELTETHAMS